MADWNSLEDQLKALGVQMGKDKRLTNKRAKRYPIEKVVSGEYWQMVTGEVFCHEEFYPMDYIHGSKPLTPSEPIEVLCHWAGAQQLSLGDLQDFVFLDTETSGLAGGTGTYAFEVGLGRFTPEGFRLAQFFMRHPGEEPTLLAGLNAFMDGMKAVVTYNGKSFDIPLLNTRYTMMGMDTPFTGIDHFDLLPLARRLWKIRLESRTLGNVEQQILGVARGEEEVPGYMIPQMYFDFLRTQDARPMAGIFYHNAIDILSLAGLFGHMAFLLDDPHSDRIRHGEDIVALARFFESMGEISEAEALYNKSLTVDLSEEIHWDTVQRLSFLVKRKGDWQAAIALWKQAAENEHLYAFVEIAKYYEHRVKDIEEAHRWTVGGITVLNSRHFPAYQYRFWQESLSHRLERLETRLARENPD
ncbi:ribonuclease H-like domain-containing protein [Chloroflexota bacterium]|nr:ribonuclease H-like domain-containing protein [Chloroflexota bacterium]